VTNRQTHRQTDHATSSVATGRIYAMHTMRPKKETWVRQFPMPLVCAR